MAVCTRCATTYQDARGACPGCLARSSSTAVRPGHTVELEAHGTPAPPSEDRSEPDPLIGQEPLGQYRIVRKIGQGGFGAVYIAEQAEVGRKAVIKVLRARHAGSEISSKRFRREATVLAALDHEHIIRLYNFGELDDGQQFIAMEYGGDRSLADELDRSGPFTQRRALRITEQVCSALQEAHNRGVIHRDLKPANILLGEKDGQDWVKVVDVGLAKILDDSAVEDAAALTGSDTTVGTPMYFSPEQARGLPLTGRSDVYAMALVLYQMLSGKLPIEAKTHGEFIRAHCSDPPIPLRTRGVSVSSEVEAILERALAKEPSQRMTAAEMGRLAAKAREALASPFRVLSRRVLVATAIGLACAAIIAIAINTSTSGQAPPVVTFAAPPGDSPPPVDLPPARKEVAATSPEKAEAVSKTVKRPVAQQRPVAPLDARVSAVRQLVEARNLRRAIAEGEKMLEQNLPPAVKGPLYKTLTDAYYDYGDSVGALRYAVLYRGYCPPAEVASVDKQISRLRVDLGIQ